MATIKCPTCGTAIHVVEKKTGLWWGIGCLVAALATPFFVGMIGLLAAIAIPSFIKARSESQRQSCINNMRIIDAAKEQAAMEHGYRFGATLTKEEVTPYLMNKDFSRLVCAEGGQYTIQPIGQDPECSVHGALSNASGRSHRSHTPTSTSVPKPPDSPSPDEVPVEK